MRLPIPWADYSSTRIDESLQRTVNMYPHSERGYRQFPGLTQLGNDFGVPSQNQTGPVFDFASDWSWQPDGLWITATHGLAGGDDDLSKRIETFAVSTAWNSSTVSGTPTDTFIFVYSGVTTKKKFFKWGDSGTKLYVMDEGTGDDKIHQHSCSPAYDVSGLVYVQSLDISAKISSPRSLLFNAAGTKLYVVNDFSRLHLYNLTAWDISTASWVGSSSVPENQADTKGSDIE